MMVRSSIKYVLSLILCAGWLMAAPAWAAPGDVERGEKIYQKRCVHCHGAEGDADTPASERLVPPPRDFTEGVYKFKTTAFDEDFPNDEDLFRMIRDGMPGTAMPGWSDLLNEQDMWDLVACIKTFAGLEEETPEKQVDYGTQVATSAESIAAGKKLFIDRCAECHGDDGKGDAIKKLKDDAGNRTWPRNLTKPWTFRVSNDPKDIYTRISIGIPGTQMPSFADPKSKKKLSVEERWHVANYAVSLAETAKVVRAENTVIKAAKTEGEAPATVDDPRWADARATTFATLPQIIAEERFFTPSNDAITVKALYSDKEIALLLEWDDRTKSLPGDTKAKEIAGEQLFEDQVSVQLPLQIPAGMEKPYFIRGDASHAVNLWSWASGGKDKPERAALANAQGIEAVEERDAAAVGLLAKGAYRAGTWRVVMRRPLKTENTDKDLQFAEGKFIPIAFTAWDGSNGETGSKHTLTTWYWLLLEPPTGMGPIFAALAVFLLLGAGEFWWMRSAARRRNGKEA